MSVECRGGIRTTTGILDFVQNDGQGQRREREADPPPAAKDDNLSWAKDDKILESACEAAAVDLHRAEVAEQGEGDEIGLEELVSEALNLGGGDEVDLADDLVDRE